MFGFDFEPLLDQSSFLPMKLQELNVLWAISVTFSNNEETPPTCTSPVIEHSQLQLCISLLRRKVLDYIGQVMQKVN